MNVVRHLVRSQSRELSKLTLNTNTNAPISTVTEIGRWAKWRWLLLYTAILRSQADSLHSYVILHEWLAFYRAFFECPPHWHGWCQMKLRTWTCSVYTIQPCTMSLHNKVMKSTVTSPQGMTGYLWCLHLHNMKRTSFVHIQWSRYANDVTMRNGNGDTSESCQCEIKAACKKKKKKKKKKIHGVFHVRNRAFYDMTSWMSRRHHVRSNFLFFPK